MARMDRMDSMYRITGWTANICLVLFLAGTGMLSAAIADAQSLEAGAAKVDITAPVGSPLNGYGARMGKNSTGVHDPLWARALYLDDGQTRLFLVGLDLVAVNPELRQRVLELAPPVVPAEHILLTATHTHSGQGSMVRNPMVRFVSGRFIPEVLESTAQGIAEAMRLAYESRRRAALGYGVGPHGGLSSNRRYSGGPVDDQLGVIAVEDADGNPISIVANFAGHPTSIGDADMFLFSADYPGYFYLEIEKLLGETCVPIFLNGALGNQTISAPEGKGGWARTEAVGRLLARKTKEIQDTIAYGPASLRVVYKNAELPLTLAEVLQPREVLLAGLEINDLLLSFFPGEPCVELGHEMRRRALARGYDAHFSVGLGNDYIMYFVPRHLYPDLTYESVMTFFGPGIEDWFYRQFESMMSKLPVDDEEVMPDSEETGDPAAYQEVTHGLLLELHGSPEARGQVRGRAMIAGIQQKYEERVLQAVAAGHWIPNTGWWQYLPSFLDPIALALPMLGMGSRPLLKGLSMDLIREMEATAEAARLPFDGFWLLQHAPLYDAVQDKTLLFNAPLCTIVAVVGDRAGADDLIVGRNLDWPFEEKPVVTRVRPDSGRSFMQVGFEWNAGVFTGMNDKGLILCVERVDGSPQSVPERAPVEFLLRDILQSAETCSAAVELLKAAAWLRGIHVLAAGFDNGKPRAVVVEYHGTPVVREPEKGLLPGILPDTPGASPEALARYARLSECLADVRIIGERDIKRAMTEHDSASSAWNENTRHSTVFLPKAKKLLAAFPDPNHAPGEYNVLTFEKD